MTYLIKVTTIPKPATAEAKAASAWKRQSARPPPPSSPGCLWPERGVLFLACTINLGESTKHPLANVLCPQLMTRRGASVHITEGTAAPRARKSRGQAAVSWSLGFHLEQTHNSGHTARKGPLHLGFQSGI